MVQAEGYIMISKTVKETAANARNSEGGAAYELSPKAALALYVCTSCLNGTYYTSAETQLKTVLELASKCKDTRFVAQVAVYSHLKGRMKEVPALLAVWLAKHDVAMLERVWDQLIDSGKMLQKFCKYLRNGEVGGYRHFNRPVRKLINRWFQSRNATSIFQQSIGNDFPLKYVIKLAHPKPKDEETSALFAYLIDAEFNGETLQTFRRENGIRKCFRKIAYDNLPIIVKQYEAWKQDTSLPMPRLDFRFFDGQKLSAEQWKEIAKSASWTQTLKNLNTYGRHQVYKDQKMVTLIAEKLASRELIQAASVFPYQIMTAYLATTGQMDLSSYGCGKTDVPREITNALQDAMEIATENTPQFGQVIVCPDVSRSMVLGRITGNRGTATTAVRCIDVAALFTASILRTNPEAMIIPFDTKVVKVPFNPRDSIITNAKRLADVNGGGTNCSAPLALLNEHNVTGDLVIFVSDYESWVDGLPSQKGAWGGYGMHHRYSDSTATMREWNVFKERNPHAKLVCIDLTPKTNGQVHEHKDILQIGGFSDNVFNVIGRFVEGGWSKNYWIKEIESIIIQE